MNPTYFLKSSSTPSPTTQNLSIVCCTDTNSRGALQLSPKGCKNVSHITFSFRLFIFLVKWLFQKSCKRPPGPCLLRTKGEKLTNFFRQHCSRMNARNVARKLISTQNTILHKYIYVNEPFLRV